MFAKRSLLIILFLLILIMPYNCFLVCLFFFILHTNPFGWLLSLPLALLEFYYIK